MGWRNGGTDVQQVETVGPATLCPDPDNHYVTYVHRGFMQMGNFQTDLNTRYKTGYRLSKAFEQGGNTVLVYEHATH